MSTLMPSSAVCCARLAGSVLANAISWRLISSVSVNSITRRLAATSKTGDTRSCHVGTASFISKTKHKLRAKRRYCIKMYITYCNIL